MIDPHPAHINLHFLFVLLVLFSFFFLGGGADFSPVLSNSFLN